MPKTAVIVHGTMGHPQENWFPGLKTELERLGYAVHVPAFPTPEGQSYESWLAIFRQIDVGDEAILIGHSSGSLFILTALNDLGIHVKDVYLVAPFLTALGNDFYDGLHSSFIAHERNWETVKRKSDKFVIYYSDNDPFVPASVSIDVANAVDGVAVEIKGAGHFNESAGYLEFPQLLEDIASL